MTGADPFLSEETDYTGKIHSQLIGDYNLYNILAAVTVGWYFEVPAPAVKDSITSTSHKMPVHNS